MLFVKREVVNKLLIENRDNASTIGKDKVALTLEKIKFK
jgi:cell division protein FtsQ